MIINEYKSRPANPHYYSTSEQMGKPFAYFFFSVTAAATGIVLIAKNMNHIYQCVNSGSDVQLAIGAGLLAGGLLGLLMIAYLLLNRDVPEIIEERQYTQPPEQPDRIATIHTSASDSIISLNQLGEKISGIFFPNHVLALVKNVGRWPTRDFWLQDATWQGTGQDKWTTDIYNKNTSKLCGVGVLEKRGNRYQLTEKGERFFKISNPPTL